MSLSERMRDSVEGIMPKIAVQVQQRSSSNPPIDLGTAENWLIRPEMVGFLAKSVNTRLSAEDLSYQKGFTGDPRLLASLATFFNDYFNPHSRVEAADLCVGPGGAAVLDSFLTATCEAGDGMLVLAPFWSGFHFQFSVRPKVKIIPVTAPDEEALGASIVKYLEQALLNSQERVRGVVVCNPQNPLGQCYTPEALAAMAQFCEEHDLHLLSDEIYALSVFEEPDSGGHAPFASVLGLDLAALEVSPSRVHMIWSLSKDFGCSGLRLGAFASRNHEVVTGVALGANTQVSSLTAVAGTALLEDRAFLESTMERNKARLRARYTMMAGFLRERGMRHFAASAGVYVWARLTERVKTWGQEEQLQRLMATRRVAVSAGKGYAAPEPGWFRLTFALPADALREALTRVQAAIADFEQQQEQQYQHQL